jgi:hypothetical protein
MRRREFIAALGGAAVWLAMRIGVICIIALMLAAVTQAVAEDTATAQPTPAEPTAVAPYLKPEQRPDIGAILSLAPQKGSVAFETDLVPAISVNGARPRQIAGTNPAMTNESESIRYRYRALNRSQGSFTAVTTSKS